MSDSDQPTTPIEEIVFWLTEWRERKSWHATLLEIRSLPETEAR